VSTIVDIDALQCLLALNVDIGLLHICWL